MSSIMKGLRNEDYTGIESGPSTGPFAGEKTPEENPYGGEKSKKFRGAISENPNETPVGDQPGGWREYSANPAGLEEELDENLHKWFQEKWVRFGPDGKIKGECARGNGKEGKPKCLPQSKAQNLGKKGRASAASRKRREDPNPNRSGKAINVNTKKKSNEGVAEGSADSNWHGSDTDMEWYDAYKDQPIRVKVKNHSGIGNGISGTFPIIKFEKIDATKAELTIKSRNGEMTGKVDLDNPETVLTKQYDRVPAMNFYIGSMPATARQAFNLFQHKSDKQDVAEEKCPHCDGPMFEASMMNEKQDACYYKVKSRYKVWPSAYASGALVQCRKKGASNWGTGGKKDESSIMKNIIDEAGNPAQQAAIAIAMKKAGKKPKNEGTYTAPGDTKLPIEEAYRKAREITKQIKYDQTVSEILVGIQMLAEKAGIPERELKYAEDAVYAASNALESAVYGLDEVFKEALDRQRYEQDDEEVDEDLGVRYAAALEEATNFAQQAAIMSMRKVGVQSKPIKESAESIEKLRKAISNRILSAHDDLLDEYGEVAVGRAIDEVSEEYGDNADQTITSQDITEFTKQVAEKVLNGSKKIEEGPSIFSGGYSGGAPRKYVAKPAGLNEAGDRAGAINTAAQLRKAIAAGKGQPHEIDLLKRQMNALVRKYNITPEELGDPNIGNKNRQQPPPPPPPGGQQRTQQPPPPPGGQQNAGGGYDWDKHMKNSENAVKAAMAKSENAVNAAMAKSENAVNAAMAASSQGPWSMPNYNNSQPPPIPPEAMMKKESSIMKGLKK